MYAFDRLLFTFIKNFAGSRTHDLVVASTTLECLNFRKAHKDKIYFKYCLYSNTYIFDFFFFFQKTLKYSLLFCNMREL